MFALPRLMLVWTAVPILLVSFCLLYIGSAPRSAQIVQFLAVLMGMALFAAVALRPRRQVTGGSRWLALALALSLLLPLLDGPGGPSRWLAVGGVRIYLAPVVLPLLLCVLGAKGLAPSVYGIAVAVASLALVLQPDAAQLSALAVGLAVLSLAFGVPRAAVFGLSLVGAVVAWRLPDPLQPVAHVEGIFELAAEVSVLALLAALLAAILLVAGLAWTALRLRSLAVGAVAAYYTVLYALAPLQLTPVPLLGFGAGPILGYFLAAGWIARGQRFHDGDTQNDCAPRIASVRGQ